MADGSQPLYDFLRSHGKVIKDSPNAETNKHLYESDEINENENLSIII